MVFMREWVLVNANNLKPPVSPLGLEYVGEALADAGFGIRVIDLALADDWSEALRQGLAGSDTLAVGVAVRNSDDCCFATGRSFLPWIRDVVAAVKRHSGAPVVLGGGGFSVMPEAALEFTGADVGIAGDGEAAAVALGRALENNEDYSQIPNLVCRTPEGVRCNPRQFADAEKYPLPRRRLFDNPLYEARGGIVGVETKRGCPAGCIYCADPVIKGTAIRLRPPKNVVAELSGLVAQGVSYFYLCDSEFNLPPEHAKDVCRAIAASGLAERILWYTYCAPSGFDRELAALMKRAGCAGINFGVDSLDDGQLSRLGRGHRCDDVKQLVDILHGEDINYMFDFLAGGPGETEDTIRTTIGRIKELKVPLAGIAAGLRVYPGTPLALVLAGEPVTPGLRPAEPGPETPVFYLASELTGSIDGLLDELVGGDNRFFVLGTPSSAASYNYAGDERLSQLILGGERGAYWDILNRNR